MKAEEFDKQAHYDYWICKDIDPRGELVHIRFVEDGGCGFSTAELLRKNGYVKCFSGCLADGFELPNYKRVLVKKDLSSEGPEGTIVAYKFKDVFDKDGNKLGVIWDTDHCGVGALDYRLIEQGNHPWWLKEVYLENKYIDAFDRLKKARRGRSFLTQMTYQEVWDLVDSGKAEALIAKEEAETSEFRKKYCKE